MKKIKIKISLMLVGFLFSFPLLGQHQPIISQFMLNKFLFNPALTGLKDQTSITAGYRKQWTGIEGAPVSYYMTGHTPLGGQGTQSHTGLGGTLFSDKIGPLRTSTISISGAYHTPLSKKFHISAGLGFGISQRSLNFSEFAPENSGDPALEQGLLNQTQPFISAGLWAFSTHYFVGISTIQAPSQDMNTGLTDHLVNVQHYFLNTGVILKLNKGGFTTASKEWLIIPSTIVRYLPAAPMVYDFNLRLVYDNTIMFGASYRNSKDVVLQVGAEVVPKRKKYQKKIPPGYFFSYSYDLGYAELGQVSAGAHEITVGLHLFRDKVKCPLVKAIPTYFF